MKPPFAAWTHLTSAIRHPFTTDVATLSSAQAASALVGFVTAAIAARLLGAREYGIAATTIALPLLVSAITSVKTLPVTTRYIEVFRTQRNREGIAAMCKVGYAIDGASAVIAVAITWLLVQWTPGPITSFPRPYLSVAYTGALVLYSMTGTAWAVLSTYRRFRALALYVVTEKVIILLIVVTGLLRGGGLATLVIGTAAGQVAGALLITLVAVRALRQDEVPRVMTARCDVLSDVRSEVKGLLGWGYLLTTAGGVITNLPILILSATRGAQQAGFYRLALTLTAPATIVEGALWRVVYPTIIARWSAGEREGLRRSIRKWAFLGGGPLGVAVLVSAALLPPVVVSMFGTSYEPMILGTQFMLCGAAVSLAFFYIGPLFYASQQVAIWAKSFTVYALLFVSAAAVVAPRFGFTGLSVVVFLGTASFNLAMALIASKVWRPN